ncbi:hypothetical protein M8756_19590, partial [Lutimaribacter sp. EGI FJ00015]|nr:hypothetical protein [Lutimaribacter sp. EGI FJ00015]
YQLFLVKLHSYTVKYMFLNFSSQWNSIGRRTRRWKAAPEPAEVAQARNMSIGEHCLLFIVLFAI